MYEKGGVTKEINKQGGNMWYLRGRQVQKQLGGHKQVGNLIQAKIVGHVIGVISFELKMALNEMAN